MNFFRLNGIKQRVFFQLGSFTVLLSLMFFGLTLMIAYIVEDELIYKMMAQEAKYIEHQFAQTGEIPKPKNPMMTLFSEISELPLEVQHVLADEPKAQEIFTPSNTHYHISYLKLGSQQSKILLADVGDFMIVTNMRQSLALVIGVVFLFCLTIATYFAYRISRYSVKPITALTEELKDRPQQNGQIIAFDRYPDEVGFLAKTLEDNINQLQQALFREKHFTRDVSHELRTPLTVIKNVLELAKHRPLTNSDFQQLQLASTEIEQTINILFMLAREEPITQDVCHINALIEQVLINCHETLEQKNIQLSLKLEQQVQLEGNEALVKLMLNNLINNAIAYASDKQLTIELEPKKLTITNLTDQTLSAERILELTSPGAKSTTSKGIGQGLFLIKRIVDAMGWQMTLSQQQQKFCVAILFAAKSSP